MSYYFGKPRTRSGMSVFATHSIYHGRREILSVHARRDEDEFRILGAYTRNTKILMKAVKAAIEIATEFGHSEVYYSDIEVSEELTKVLEELGFVCVLSDETFGYKYVRSLTA